MKGNGMNGLDTSAKDLLPVELFIRSLQLTENSALLLRLPEEGPPEAVYVSDSLARMLECAPERAAETLTGEGFFNSFDPEDRPQVRELLSSREAEGRDLTLRVDTAEGNRLWCALHFVFVRDLGDSYICCTYTNVTLLKQYEERLSSVYSSLGKSFYQEDERTLSLLRVNLTRDTVEEIRGADLYPTDAAAPSFSALMSLRGEHYPNLEERERLLRTFDPKAMSEGYLEGKAAAREVVFSRRGNGRNCFVELSAAVTRHPLSGDVVAFITERECNAEKVRQTLLRKILARQFDMVAYLVDGKYGVTIGEAANITRGSIFPAARTGDYQTYLRQQVFPVLCGTEEYRKALLATFSMETVERQTRLREPYVVNIAIEIDGEIFHKRFDFYRVDPEARFYIVLKSDTTELSREQMERNRQLSSALADARQANQAKTAFLSTMSHEIRTPMNAIIGLDSIALKDPDLTERTRGQLEKIGGSAKHLLELINDILDMGRIESGNLTLRNETFAFNDLLEQLSTMIGSQCHAKGLEYDCRVVGKVEKNYIGDIMKLKQALLNLLGNAVKFTPAPGRVLFQVEQIEAAGEQRRLRFLVKDTGIGIDESYLPKLFDPFSQEDATTTNRYGGSGLGLAVAKSIVDMMDGSITVESRKGEGSAFTVEVTLRRAVSQDDDRAALRPQDMKVLIIDNDPVACEHARLVLEEIGISADTALGGEEGLEMVRLRHARRDAYNLILVDLRMPGMDGMEVTRRIRSLYGEESAVIILSAYSWADLENEGILAGVDSFMSKPLFAGSILYEFRAAIAKAKEKARQAEKPPADLTGRRILVAEDMMINAEIIIELLEMMDMQAEHAENGKLALEMFESHPEGYYDAILMDMRMPEMDGLAATRAIRELPRPDAETIPIIALTANAFDDDVQRSLQAGLDAHLTKPVEPERLFETLSELIKN